MRRDEQPRRRAGRGRREALLARRRNAGALRAGRSATGLGRTAARRDAPQQLERLAHVREAAAPEEPVRREGDALLARGARASVDGHGGAHELHEESGGRALPRHGGARGGVAQRAPRARRVEGGGRAGHDGPRLGGLGRGGGAVGQCELMHHLAHEGLVDEGLRLHLAVEVGRAQGGLAQPLQEARPRAVDHAEDAAARGGAQVDEPDVEQRGAALLHAAAHQAALASTALASTALASSARGGRAVVRAPRLGTALDVVLHHLQATGAQG